MENYKIEKREGQGEKKDVRKTEKRWRLLGDNPRDVNGARVKESTFLISAGLSIKK
jgi:hypothetical protein